MFNYAVVLSLCRLLMSLSVVDGVVSHPYSPLVIAHSTKELIFYHTFRRKSIHTRKIAVNIPPCPAISGYRRGLAVGYPASF